MIIVELIFPVLPVFHLVLLFNSWKQLLYRFCLFLHDTHYSVLKGSKCQRHSVFFVFQYSNLAGNYLYEIYRNFHHVMCSEQFTTVAVNVFKFKTTYVMYGFPRCDSGKESVCQWRRHLRHGFDSWVRKIPWRSAWQPTPIFWPGEFHG